MANNRSIGSLALLALLACSGSSDDHGPEYPPPPLQARWGNMFRMPDLRAVRFINPDQGIIAGASTAIFRTDTGTSLTPTWWQQEHMPFARGGDIAAMDMIGSELHAVGSDATGGRWWTTLNAIEWTTPDASSAPPAFTAVDVIAPGQAYYLRADGTLRLVQGGAVTNLSTGLAGTWQAIDFAGTTGRGYVGGAGGLIRKSLDAGANWATQPLPGAVGTPTIRDFSLILPTLVFACGDGVVVKTVDGIAWTDARGNLPGGLMLRGIHFPVDELTGWVVGDLGTIYKTVDGGTLWTQQGAGLVTANLHDVWFVSVSVGYAVGDAGTILRTLDGGANWSNITRGTLDDFNAVDFTQDGSRGIAVGNGGKAFRTLDGGATWSALALGVTVDLHGVAVFSATGEVAWICGASGTLLKTVNLGAAVPVWTAPAQVLPAVTFRAIHLPSTSNEFMAYAVGDGGTLLKSQDGGLGAASWTQQTLPGGTFGTPDFHAISSTLSGVTLVVAGADGKVAYTDMAGALWSDITIPGLAGQTVRSIQSPTASDLFAAVSDGTLRRGFTLSGTPPITTWTSSSPGFTANGIAFTSTSDGWGVDGGIYYTENGGATVPWTRSQDHYPNAVVLRAIWMSQNVPGLGFAVGTGGTILKTTVGGK